MDSTKPNFGDQPLPGWFRRAMQEQALFLGLVEIPKSVTYEDFRRLSHMTPRPVATATADLWLTPNVSDPEEPSYEERRRAAAGPWAFVLELEADDAVWRRLLGQCVPYPKRRKGRLR